MRATRGLGLVCALSLAAAACGTTYRVQDLTTIAPITTTTTVAAPAAVTPATPGGRPPTDATIGPTSSTTTTSTTTTTTTTLPPPPPLVLGFAGDTSFTHGLAGRDPFAAVGDLLSAPDLMFVNLETAIAEADVGSPQNKVFTFKSPPESVTVLRDAGIDVVALANNHTLDFNRPALLRTLELLDEGGIARAGAGTDGDEAYAPTYLEGAGRTVGFVSLSHIPCDWSAYTDINLYPEVAWTCDRFRERAAEAVAVAAANSDVAVVMVHWGIEREHCPQAYQRELAAAWAEAGADLVIGGHPHVLQGIERIGSTWVVHSLGNFAFPSARDTSSYSAVYTFTVGDDGIALRVHPVRVGGGIVRHADDGERTAILDLIDQHSFGWNLFTDGTPVVSTDPGIC